MSDNQHTVTTVFKADISNFSKSTQDLNRYISTVNSEFKNAVAGLDNWSRSQEGLQAKITQLNKVLEAEKKKLGNLESAYDEMVAAGKENTAEAQKLATAINNQSAKVKATEKDIAKYTDSLEELQDAGVETRDELDALNKELAENEKAAAKAANETKELAEEQKKSADSGGKLKGIMGGVAKGLVGVGAAAVGVVGSFVALAESTREYRNEMAKLDTAFADAEFSAAAAEKTYSDLYGVLGDSGRATEAAQQLAKMSKTEADLAANTRILTGVMGLYGDSIPTEGLAEGMAATAAMGEVQGVLADALEWQGVNLDEYNAQLAELATEEERAAFIQSTLTDLYGDAADAYAENNKEIIEANKAQANLTEATAQLGAIAEPINTILKNIGATIINGLLPYIKDLAGALQTIFNGDIAGGAETISGIFTDLTAKAGEALGNILNTTTELLPQLLPILAETLASIVSSVAGLLPEILPQLTELLSVIIQSLVSALPSLVSAASSLFLGIVQAIPPTIVTLLAELPKIIDTVLTALSDSLPLILSAAEQAFMAIVDALPSVLSALVAALPKILTSIINFLLNSAPKLLTQAISFLMKIVESIPTIVSELAANLPKIITSIVGTLASNAPKILKTAVSMLGEIVKAIPQIGRELLSNAPQIITSIVKGLAGGYKALFNIGSDMLKGLWEGIKSLKDWIFDKISGFFNNTIVGGIKKLLGIHSPSKVFAEMGKYSAEGYIEGFTGTMQSANKTLARVNYAGAVGIVGRSSAAQQIGGNTYNVYQTFEGMESTQYALHRAKVEMLNAVKLSEA